MYSSANSSLAIEVASRVWSIDPYLQVRMPDINANQAPVAVDAIWTDYNLRPSANNLAFLIQYVRNPAELKIWKKRLAKWPVRGALLTSVDKAHLFYPEGLAGDLHASLIDRESLATALSGSKSHLFAPKSLSGFRTGQLSLADLEESITKNSFSFLHRQRTRLDKAFQDGIQSSLEVVRKNNSSSNYDIEGHVIRIAIAYLAARILEDKHFFESDIPTNDPRQLLRKTVDKTNGFFKRAFDRSIPYLEEFLPDKSDEILQKLAVHLGDRVTFSLVDHRDVGRLYERAIKELPTSQNLQGQEWTDLQRHYTPVAIAERMLEMLPLERLRPEDRVIFDPAAGSGSLLLAATSRLAGMSDLPSDRQSYLKHQVMGNDLDQYANLITNLRYILATESLGKSAVFPSPEYFSSSDYNDISSLDLPRKPNVIIANPPFQEQGEIQVAARFVNTAFSWLGEGSQYSFILPQSFLTNTTHGIPEVRRLLNESSHILEVCQIPEKVVGVEAEQAVCIVTGIVGKPTNTLHTISRATFTREKTTQSNIREFGFLGSSWIAGLESNDTFWQSTTAPSIHLAIPTICLGSLFFVFNGVTPSKHYKPVAECPPGIECKLNWRLKWREENRLWANPQAVSIEERWICYGADFLHRHAPDVEHLFDDNKLLVGRSVNRGSRRPLVALLDDVGLCPDNNVFCIVPIEHVNQFSEKFAEPKKLPKNWLTLSDLDQNCWLLGILSSDIANAISLVGRGSRTITCPELQNFPLPIEVDLEIIEITKKILARDKRGEEIPTEDALYQELNQLVEKSYGNPHWIEIQRTGKPPELKDWSEEQSQATWSVSGQVLEISPDKQQVKLYLTGLSDDDQEQWIPLPQELPGWALDGTVFQARLSQDIETFEQLAARPWALRHFRHTPRPYLTETELMVELGLSTEDLV